VNAVGVQPEILKILQRSHGARYSSSEPVVGEVDELELRFG